MGVSFMWKISIPVVVSQQRQIDGTVLKEVVDSRQSTCRVPSIWCYSTRAF